MKLDLRLGRTTRARNALLCVAAAVTLGRAAAAQGWPLLPRNQTHPLWHGYGTFTDLGGPHMHEGIDIPVVPGTNVYPVQGGTIVEVGVSPGPADFITVAIDAGGGTTGWLYAHIVVGNNRRERRPWAVGDVLSGREVLARIVDHLELMDHLHLGYHNMSNGGWHPTGTVIADVEGDPLDILAMNADGVSPMIWKSATGGHYHYREAGDGADSGAFFEEFVNDCTVVHDNTDVVVRAHDWFGSHAGATDYHIGVKKIEFSVSGVASIATQVLEDFTGLFLEAEGDVGFNRMAKFSELPRVNTLYEDVDPARSIGHSDGAGGYSINNGRYYYILTNKDDDDLTEALQDARRYWDTDGKKGQAWNDINEDSPHNEAVNNADAAFPDGYYTFTVTAYSHGNGAAPTTVSDELYVNNFSQDIAPDCPEYSDGYPVSISGWEFRPNRTYSVYVAYGSPSDGTPIWSGGIANLASVTSDANGYIPVTVVWDSYEPNGDPDAGYAIVIDYDDDGLFHDSRNYKEIDARTWIRGDGELKCPPDFTEVWMGGPPSQTDPMRTGWAWVELGLPECQDLDYSDVMVPGGGAGAPELVIERTWTLDNICCPLPRQSCQQRIVLLSPYGLDGSLTLDAAPRQCPNTFAPEAGAVSEISLVGTWLHDVTQLSSAGLVLRRADGLGRPIPVKPAWITFHDVTRPFYGPLGECHALGAEGNVDAVISVSNWLLRRGFQLDQEPAGATVELSLSGVLLDGTSFDVRDVLMLP